MTLSLTREFTDSEARSHPGFIEVIDKDVDTLALAINKFGAKAFAAGYNEALADVVAGRYNLDNGALYARLLAAVKGVYYYGRWTTNKSAFASAMIEEQLWTELRDAAGFVPGNSPKPDPGKVQKT